MDRKRAIAIAGAVALGMTAAAMAVVANVGLLSPASANDTIGKLSSADVQVAKSIHTQKPQVVTIYVDDAPKAQPASAQPREIVITETRTPEPTVSSSQKPEREVEHETEGSEPGDD